MKNALSLDKMNDDLGILDLIKDGVDFYRYRQENVLPVITLIIQ